MTMLEVRLGSTAGADSKAPEMSADGSGSMHAAAHLRHAAWLDTLPLVVAQKRLGFDDDSDSDDDSDVEFAAPLSRVLTMVQLPALDEKVGAFPG